MQNTPRPSSKNAQQARRRAEARRRRKRQILRNRIIFGVGCLALLALVIFGVTKVAGLFGEKDPSDAASVSSSQAVSEPVDSQSQPQSESQPQAQSQPESQPEPQPESAPPVEEEVQPEPMVEIHVDPNDRRLILVNNNIPLPEEYQMEAMVADEATAAQLQTEAAQAYIRMKDAAAAQNIELVLASGYRSWDQQRKLFEAQKQQWLDDGFSEEEAVEKTKRLVDMPGYSEHSTGFAADIVSADHREQDDAFEDTDAYGWLCQHAHEFGFILRYPKDKQAITGAVYRPWHYRYVGPENAAAIKSTGLCLEEYLTAAG